MLCVFKCKQDDGNYPIFYSPQSSFVDKIFILCGLYSTEPGLHFHILERGWVGGRQSAAGYKCDRAIE